MTIRTGSWPDKGSLPRWARIAVVYLSVTVTVAVVGAALLAGSFETGLDAAFREGLRLAVIVLTLPVSAAYFAVGFLLDSSGPPSSGGLSPTAVLYCLGYVALAVVNAALFRWMILSIRKRVPAGGAPGTLPQDPGATMRGSLGTFGTSGGRYPWQSC